MGFFSRLFSSEPDIRSQLRRTYAASFQHMGMATAQAQELADTLLAKAEARSRAQGTDKYPPRFGDVLLDRYSSDEKSRGVVDALRAGGVRDEDIRWWWSMHDLERCMLVENDEMSRFTLFSKERSNGRSQNETAEKVRRHFPVFGSLDGNIDITDDRPLPFELKDRINRFFENPNQQHLRTNALRFSSMNAYIRDRMKNAAL